MNSTYIFIDKLQISARISFNTLNTKLLNQINENRVKKAIQLLQIVLKLEFLFFHFSDL